MAKPDAFGSKKQAESLTPNPKPSAQEVEDFHSNADTDVRPEAIHHTLGSSPSQASPGNHTHNGSDSPLLLDGIQITGSRSDGSAVASIIAGMVRLGAKDTSTP